MVKNVLEKDCEILCLTKEKEMLILNSKQNEPEPLRRGKKFHKEIQKDWINTAQGSVKSEKGIIKPSGRKGRIDIFVKSDDELVAIAEIKNSDWDVMTEDNIKRNVNRQSRQIWGYIESQLKKGKEVSPGIIFSKTPKDKNRMKFIEKLFEENGIPVVWNDETIEERKARS